MKFILRLLGLPLISLEVEPPEYEVIEEEHEPEITVHEDARLGTSDLSFGFQYDPVFRPIYWEDEE